MKEVFADTFYWLAILNPKDSQHEQAIEIQVPGPIVTHWGVIIEVMDALCSERTRPLAVRFWEEITSAQEVIIIPLDESLLMGAADLFGSRRDKEWSMTDCLSFVVMSEREIEDALTGDHHFEQAGFQILF